LTPKNPESRRAEGAPTIDDKSAKVQKGVVQPEQAAQVSRTEKRSNEKQENVSNEKQETEERHEVSTTRCMMKHDMRLRFS
jgi:hypothetical protein